MTKRVRHFDENSANLQIEGSLSATDLENLHLVGIVEARFPLQNPDANFKRFANLQIQLGTRTLRWVFRAGIIKL